MKTYTYPYLLTWIAKLLEGKATTGSNQTEEYIQFTELNLKRMERIDKTLQLNDELKTTIEAIRTKQKWTVITEAWCGDSAQTLPVIYKMSEINPGFIELEIVLRDDNPTVMAQYQTDGSNSIPILIVRNEHGDDLFVWGPRPKPAQDLYANWNSNPNGKSKADIEIELQNWYNRDGGKTIQDEVKGLLG
jgi:hypothetical protein